MVNHDLCRKVQPFPSVDFTFPEKQLLGGEADFFFSATGLSSPQIRKLLGSNH